MNFFEQELQKIVSRDSRISNSKYVGGACYGELGDDLRVKLQFVTLGTSQRYEGIKATILNRRDGPVDQAVFRFADVLGIKQVPNQNFPRGLVPYAWTYDGKTDWYVYHPNQADYKQLGAGIDEYCGVFQSHELAAPEQDNSAPVMDDTPELTL